MKSVKLALVFAAAGLALLAGGYVPPSIGQRQPNIKFSGRAASIAVHPNDSNKIIVASDSGGLFRSLNGGTTWTHVSGNTTFWFTDVVYVPSNPNIVLASAWDSWRVSTGASIWRSLNGGANWSQVALSPPACNKGGYDFFASDLFAETGRDRLWAATTCGAAYSQDQGATWTFLPETTGYVHEPVWAIIAPSTGRLVIRTWAGLRISTDDGSSWSLSVPNLPQTYSIDAGAHNQIAFAPNNPDHLYWTFNYYHSGRHMALFRSTDNGGTWIPLSNIPFANRPPFVRTALSLTGFSEVYDVYSSDGGSGIYRQSAHVGGGAVTPPTLLSSDHGDAADIAFSSDHKTPILLATDGGLHKTVNNGLNWTLAGGGPAGYNALQIHEVTGQMHNGDGSADLYFATQDNGLWASPDEGLSWASGVAPEGVRLNVPRDYYPANQTQVTGRIPPSQWNFISGRLYSNVAGFQNVPEFFEAPRLLLPGTYVQETWPQDQSDFVFDLTTNSGANWSARFGFPETPQDLAQIAGSINDPILYTPVRTTGVTPEGYPVILLKRIAGVLGNNTPLVSNVSGFGGLGFHSNMWASYASFGVDPHHPNYLLVADVIDDQMKVSTDGGATWQPDTALTDLVTQSSSLKFHSRWWTQSTAIAFDPECDGHILVGTQQAGILETLDRGSTWYRLGNSDLIPQVSSFFFPGNDTALVSSYGRGLWRYVYTCPGRKVDIPKPIEFAEPIIFWEGARIPISQIHDPDACPACGYFLALGGKILDYKSEPDTGQLTEVVINRGEVRGYTWNGVEIPLSFEVLFERGDGSPAIGNELKPFLHGGNDIKGLFTEGGVLRGLMIYSADLTVDDLPHEVALGPHIRLLDRGSRPIDEAEPMVVIGAGFDPLLPLEVFLDGQPVAPDAPPDFDADGNFTFLFTPQVGLGAHALLVRQGEVQDVVTFGVSVHEAEEVSAP